MVTTKVFPLVTLSPGGVPGASFCLRLSSPKIPAPFRAATLPGFLDRLFVSAGENYQARREEAVFAIHPGGPEIIGSAQTRLSLTDGQVAASRAVLFERGNMSSATLPHIWAKIIDEAGVSSGTPVVSLAFGPGLTIAGALFKKR